MLMQRLIGKMYRSILERIIVAFPVSNVNKQLDIPTKILISNGAHLGDLVNATTLCHALKKAVPAEAPFPAGLVSDVVAEAAPAAPASEEAPAAEVAAEAESADVEKKDASDEG